MELNTAVRLIQNGIPKTNDRQSWADLGAGRGLFTTALSRLLPEGSSITAIDKETAALKQISVNRGIQLETKALDFTSASIGLKDLDGILMANALHYVKDQTAFLEKLKKITSRIILVEYDTDKSNPWVPYPISFNKLKSFQLDVKQIGEEPSVYQKGGMYSALILF